ncbi:MAG: hypothetical protein QHJ73_11250, partial [Armatimonadota bacterium]|nr:hypothetical protein [Armatimonadota bacterium]
MKKVALGVLLAALPAVAGPRVDTRGYTPMPMEQVRGQIGPRAAEMLAAYRLWEAGYNEGRGRSDRKDSGSLGWNESGFLRNYVRAYAVSRDPYWLDKVVDHFDRMIANMTQGEDGFRRWTDTAYGVSPVAVTPESGTEGMSLEPPLQRPYVGRGGELVNGHRYRVALPDGKRVVITDLTEGRQVADLEYQEGLVLTQIPGAKLTLTGPGRPGARFLVETTAARPIDYAVHDGMVTYPVALWVETVLADAALRARYGKKAEEYLALLDRHVREKWERCWVELPNGAGAYTFSPDPTERFPGGLLPHNQYLALARTWLVLQAIPGAPNRALYREKAEKMARNFRAALRLEGNAYVWNYWDPRPEDTNVRRHIEDTGHGSIDVGFAVEAQRRGIVFTDEDLKRFAATYVERMWNGSLQSPEIARTVDGSIGGGRNFREWISLAAADRRVWDVGWGCYQRDGLSPDGAPEVLEVYDRVFGLTEAERRQVNEAGKAAGEFTRKGWQSNLNFEQGVPGAAAPFGWTLTAWTPDGGSEWGWTGGGRNGSQCIFLRGKNPPVNVLAQPNGTLPLNAPGRVTLRAWYRTEGDAKPLFSLI